MNMNPDEIQALFDRKPDVHVIGEEGPLEEPNTCSSCGKKFLFVSTLAIHQKVKHGWKPKDSKSVKTEPEVQEYRLQNEPVVVLTRLEDDNCRESAPESQGSSSEDEAGTEDAMEECSICKKVLKSSYMKFHKIRYHKQNKDADYKECPVCHRSFRASFLKWHMRSHKRQPAPKVGEEYQECEYCKKSFKVSFLKIHILRRHKAVRPPRFPDAEMTECPICQKLYKTTFVKLHILRQHNRDEEVDKAGEEETTECPICHKNYKASYIKWHFIRNHKEETSHKAYENEEATEKCPICHKTYKASYMKWHKIRSHKNEKHVLREMRQQEARKREVQSQTCDVCNEVFPNKTLLSRHKFTTHDRVPSKCEQCGVVLASKYGLKSHMAIHTNEAVLCPYCGKKFIASRLAQHLLIHGPKNYACKICDKKFAQPAGLRQHEKFHDPDYEYSKSQDLSKLTCDICGKTLKTSLSLYAHKRQIHGLSKAKVCTVCGKPCSNNQVLRAHMNSHTKAETFDCLLCSNSYSWERSLSEHMKKAHNVFNPNGRQRVSKVPMGEFLHQQNPEQPSQA